MLLDLRRRRQKKVLPSEHQKVLLIVLCFWFSTQIIPPGGNFAPYCELDLSPSLDISSISRLRGRYGYGYGYALLDYLPGGGGSTLRLFASSPLRLFDPSRIPRWDTSAVYYLAHVTAQAAAVFARPKTRRIAFVTLFFVYFPGNFPLSTT